jgi:hypothetical protein
LAAKKNAQEAFLRSVLQNEGKCWTEFYKYVKRRKGNRENTPALKDCNGRLISNPIEKANFLIPTMLLYSAVSKPFRKYNQLTQVNSSLLT